MQKYKCIVPLYFGVGKMIMSRADSGPMIPQGICKSVSVAFSHENEVFLIFDRALEMTSVAVILLLANRYTLE